MWSEISLCWEEKKWGKHGQVYNIPDQVWIRVLSPNGEVFMTLLLKYVRQAENSACRKRRVWWSRENEPVNDIWWTVWMNFSSWIPRQSKGLTLKTKPGRKACIMFPKPKGAAKLTGVVLTSLWHTEDIYWCLWSEIFLWASFISIDSATSV